MVHRSPPTTPFLFPVSRKISETTGSIFRDGKGKEKQSPHVM